MTGRDAENLADDPFEMATWDVARAHFHGEARRWIYTNLPEGQVGQTLQKHVWNARRGVILARHMVRSVEREFHEGRSRVHRFLLQSRRRTRGLCHCDDFCVVGRRKQLRTFGRILEKRFEVKQTGHIGFGASDKKELKILNRTIEIDVLNDEMTREADTKLVEGASKAMKLTDAKGVDSPRVRKNEEQTAQIENSEKLTSIESTLYRSLVTKVAYVAQDRVDIAEEVKCLTRHMKEPRSGHMQDLKRLGRHLARNRRCVLANARQSPEATLQVHVDSDWAGDLLGRKSTTGVITRRGKHLLRHMSCLQTLVALSSGEAEYYALLLGACTSLGIQSHYQDWMVDVPIQKLARRGGIGGRLRHLQTRHSWLQSRIALGHVNLDVVASEQNPADVLTKPLARTHKFEKGQNMLVKDGCSNHDDNNNK